MQTSIPASVFEGVRGVRIDEARLLHHTIRPSHTSDVISSIGIQEGQQFAVAFPLSALYRLDVDKFGQDVHAALKNSVAGYVMQLRQKGKIIYHLKWNWAKTPTDGSAAWEPDVRMHVASVSKLITAIAMTKLLHDRKMSFDTPIAAFLPQYWSRGPNVHKITFRHLMTHRSGFTTGGSSSDFSFMQANVSNGVAKVGKFDYENMNFGLCRILIATINGNVNPNATFSFPLIPNFNDLAWDYLTIESYKKYVEDHVFTPAGVSGPTLTHPSDNALAYAFPAGSGWDSGDLTSMSGGAAWHMSVDDVLRVMAHFRRRGTIMTPAQAEQMLENGFGIDQATSTSLGVMYNKNGWWGSGDNRVEQSVAYFLPRNMELVVLANSPFGAAIPNLRDTVTKLLIDNIKLKTVYLHIQALAASITDDD